MTIESLKGQSRAELVARRNQLAGENFKESFTPEAMTPAKGAEIRKRRRELARIETVLMGRARLDAMTAEKKALEARVEKLKGEKSALKAVNKARARIEQIERVTSQLAGYAEKG